jgi:tRNA (guanosine-2'-O-)-methyltransferase
MKSNLRVRADRVKSLRCKNLIAVLENPKTVENIGSAVRNVNALGVEKLYVVDGYKILPEKWEDMRERHNLSKLSVSAIKWTYVRVFRSTGECLGHLGKKGFISMVTSPHVKGRVNIRLDEGKYIQPKLAIWFGNEAHGVSDEVISRSEACINIPMCGIIESLNLGTCTGIVMYEVTKQRRAYSFNRRKI